MSALGMFGGQRRSGEESPWMSVSDLMAGLMMIFLFIAVAFMRYIMIEKNRIEEMVVLADSTQGEIYERLNEEFADDLERWRAEIERETMTVRFREPEVLFDQGTAELRLEFQIILTEFFPRYLMVLDEFEESIDEVRIEGHTSSEWRADTTPQQAYFRNMELSQARTRSVLEFALGLPEAVAFPWSRQRISAVGMSSARLELTAEGEEDAEASRRVEFTVKTNFERRIIRAVLDRT